MLAVLALLACAGRAPAVEPAAIEAPPADAVVFEALADDLTAGPFPEAADLAAVLADGAADPRVREAARELLEALRDVEPPQVEACPEPATEDPLGVAADARALGRTADERIAVGRDALRRGDYLAAIEVLEPLAESDAWRRARPFWEEAVDAHVARERERAGERYLRAKRLPRDARRAEIEAVRAQLAELLDRWPHAALADALERNLERIERELEAMGG